MYYLPINIDERRIHICQLSNEKQEQEPIFGFLFTTNTLFVTNPNGNAELISEQGKNIDLRDYHFECKKSTTEDDSEIYDFYFKQNNNEDQSSSQHIIPDNVPFAIDTNNNSFGDNGVKVLFKTRNRTKVLNKSFMIKIHFEEDDVDYCYSFKGHPAKADNIVNAAVDFGSEASQIKIDESPIDIKQILYKNYYDNSQNSYALKDNEKIEKDLWQSDPNTNFYRSNYFISKQPGQTNFGDKPNNNGKKTYIHALLPLTIDKEDYNDLQLLPNLKLMDLLDDFVNKSMSDKIDIPNGSNINEGATINALSDNQFRQSTLRLILSNLLHCVIATPNKGKQFLRLVMLMPNVYDQQKVYSIVKGLYQDFDIISEGDNKFTGLEVAVISESDASFLGFLNTRQTQVNDISQYKNPYCLIVDAGKGTTDFSIMRPEKKNNLKWDSLYRGGLPASGNAMTYAIYEALWAFFKRKKDWDLDEELRKGEKALIGIFINHLETLKANYSNFEEAKTDDQINIPDNTSGTQSIQNSEFNETDKPITQNGNKSKSKEEKTQLKNINTNILENIIKKKLLVPGTKVIMKNKVNVMSDIIVKGIRQYMTTSEGDKNNKTFCRVIFSGRAFMLKEFQDSLTNKLIEAKLVENENAITKIDDDNLKKICLDGSMAIGSNAKFIINNNSELICHPIINAKKKTIWGSIGGKIRDIFRSIPEINKTLKNKINQNQSTSSSFYYDGLDINTSGNSIVRMGIGSTILNPNVDHIYYVGDGLLVKYNNNINDDGIVRLTRQHTFDDKDNDTIKQLIKESLFPYHPSSICPEGRHKSLFKSPNKRTTQTEKPSQDISAETQKSTISDNPGSAITTSDGTNNDGKKDEYDGINMK